MSKDWANTDIAHPMGFAYGVLFENARSAIAAYKKITNERITLPSNVCPEIAHLADDWAEINECGLSPGVQMYGFRRDHVGALDLDPLMTGWYKTPCSAHSIVSFGRQKILPLNGGGAFLTNDDKLAAEMSEGAYFPGGERYAMRVQVALHVLDEIVDRRWDVHAEWDRILGDTLGRFDKPAMPWNVMRHAETKADRDRLVDDLRKLGIAVSTNYPPLVGGNEFGDTVISFPILHDQLSSKRSARIGLDDYIHCACETIEALWK